MLAVLVSLLTLVAGCPAPAGTNCLTNRDCPAFQVCIGGRCEAPSGLEDASAPDAARVDVPDASDDASARGDASGSDDAQVADASGLDGAPGDAGAGPDAWSCAACDDGLACTTDVCEMDLGCTHTAVDRDGDRFAAERVDGELCGGTAGDCDDSDAAVSPGATETCGNGRDENCNGLADEGCAVFPEDCATARAIPVFVDSGTLIGTGSVSGNTTGMRDDYHTSCNDPAPRSPDAVYYVDVPTTSDVIVDTVGVGYDTVLGVSTLGCGRDSFEDACNDDLDIGVSGASRIFVHGVVGSATARVYILVDAYSNMAGPYTLHVTTYPAATDECMAPLDITGGGTVVGTLSPGSLMSGSCQSGMEAMETQAVFRFNTPADRRIELLRATSGAFAPDLYVRSVSCTGAERACVHGGGDETTATGITLMSGERVYAFVDGGGPGDTYTLDYDP